MAQLRVGKRKAELPAALAEEHPPVADLHDLRLAAVDQVRPPGMPAAAGRGLAVARPADQVALAQLDPLGVADAQIARRIARGAEPALALRMGQNDLAAVVAHDGADVVRAAAEDVAVEHYSVSGLVAADIGSQRTGEPPVDQAVDGERAAPQRAFLRRAPRAPPRSPAGGSRASARGSGCPPAAPAPVRASAAPPRCRAPHGAPRAPGCPAPRPPRPAPPHGQAPPLRAAPGRAGAAPRPWSPSPCPPSAADGRAGPHPPPSAAPCRPPAPRAPRPDRARCAAAPPCARCRSSTPRPPPAPRPRTPHGPAPAAPGRRGR